MASFILHYRRTLGAPGRHSPGWARPAKVVERKEFRGRLDLQVGSRRLIFEEINSRIEGPRGDPGDKGERGYEGVKGTKAGLAHKHQTSFTHPDPRLIS